MTMRMRQVEAFRAVMMSGGITAAAQMLNVSQPSVSRLIADLERAVGFRLFDRRGARVHPTEQAQMLFEAVRRSYTGLDLLDQAARRIRAHPVGTVRIAALAAIAMSILPAVIQRFRILYPDIKVTVESLGQRGIEERVFLGQADLGVGVDIPPREGIRTTSVARAEYVCILPSGHPLAQRGSLAVADLAGEEFIGPMHEADALWNGIDAALASSGVAVSRRLETQHSQILYAFVEAGLGISIAEPFSAPLFHRVGVAIRPITPPVYLDFALLEPDIGPTPEIVSWLHVEIMRETAACLDHVHKLIATRP
ncbi:LysR family transcriptional regulator [Novosphingobium sp. NBM11]|jgi:DNA-binding transcriptional LysR family regulator|uniref:LysR substrate-binding domain-containing protein n=3 Tax=Novosphingobium TaxID=165696 RepID=UPI000F5F361C|nr:LysR substrate-binding domain-containing protein [Novosphingobium sp. NBM11]MBF5093022.1 LysR family transcriptional regulator [Novosphingobium sp. NBM11]RQW43746.1 LysR family transcriptional regulator [Novosphingobium sp. LASN5T]